MSQEKFNEILDSLRELGCKSNIVILGYSEKKEQMVISIPHEDGASTRKMTSNLAKIFKTILSAAEKQEDKTLFTIMSNAFASAALPYINGHNEQELAGMALLGL